MVSLQKLADACDSVAQDLKKGKLKTKDLRRNYVFFQNGACGCAFGHVLARAGAKPRMAPFFTTGSSGGKSARWTDNCGAFSAATGVEVVDFDESNPVGRRLTALELANDASAAEDRRLAVCNALWDLAAELRAA
jgi:hypothetical protein